MKKTSTKAEIAYKMSQKIGKSQAECENFIDALRDVIKSELAQNKRVEIRKFISIEKHLRRYSAYDFNNNTSRIEKKEVVKAKISKYLNN